MFAFDDESFEYLWLASIAPRPTPVLMDDSVWVVERDILSQPIDAIWERIAPATPDVLKALHEGVFEARWWTPVPPLDVETLLRLESITIIGQPYEPADLPMGCAVRFSINPAHHNADKRSGWRHSTS